MEYPLTRIAISRAREEYLNLNFTEPKQFNIQKVRDEEGDTFWNCEFCEEEEIWVECTRWISANNPQDRQLILDIFWTCEPDLIDLSGWNEEWTTQV